MITSPGPCPWARWLGEVGTALVVLLCARPALAQSAPRVDVVDTAFAAFWAAASPAAAAEKIAAIVASGVSFDDALARLRQGRAYAAGVPRGRQDLTHTVRRLAHPYTIVVPDDYDPTRAYPVRVQLHGGVGRPLRSPSQAGDAVDRIPGTIDQIYVLPSAWPESVWWFDTQTDNVSAILDQLKRKYNVDENRVYMTGISDGGTGAYFFAFRAPTSFASFLPLNGHMMVLANPAMQSDGDIFPGNAANKPLFVVNGGRDPLYPAEGVQPYVEHLEDVGTEVVFRVREEAGHNTAWWLEERAAFEQFVATHPRNPLPDRLSWQTERTDRYNRFDWLIIDRLGHVDPEADLPSSNLMRGSRRVFPQAALNGRVDLVRRGNRVEASTEGVGAFTLLLAPSQFDFGKPVTVVVNGRTAFQGRVTPSLETLLEWAARDSDRTALYGAALRIEVGK
jgi:poly(3-hydroxybutyrate) depolymerase